MKEKCVFRLRIKELSALEGKLILYLSAISPLEKFLEPDDIGAALTSKFGPYYDHLEISTLLAGWLEPGEFLEEFKRQGMWQAKAALEMIGAIIDNMDDNTSLFVVSDHGLMATNKIIWINNLLVKNGFIGLNGEAKYTGKELHVFNHDIIDFKKTKAICYPYVGIWVNLKGRDPEGIVEPGDEYEKVREDIIKLLRGQKDPETGNCIFADVFKIEDGGFYGL